MGRSLGGAGLALALVLLVGCSGSGSSSSSADTGGGAGAAVAPVGGPKAPDSDADRQVVTTATASVEVKDPVAGAQRVSELVDREAGERRGRPGHAGRPDGGQPLTVTAAEDDDSRRALRLTGGGRAVRVAIGR